MQINVEIPNRNQTLDGLRGLLALIVLIGHAAGSEGLTKFPFTLGHQAVWFFFILSAIVLTKSYNGFYLEFLLRRWIRLFPVYFICLLFGRILYNKALNLDQILFLPISRLPPIQDVPAWSLTIEFWAMPFLPILVWVRNQSKTLRPVLVILLCLSLTIWFKPEFFFGIFFVIGAWLSKLDFKVKFLESTLPQYLGRISYPLYLIHWPILYQTHFGLGLKLGLIWFCSEVLTQTIEKFSIKTSKQIRFRPNFKLRQDRSALRPQRLAN